MQPEMKRRLDPNSGGSGYDRTGDHTAWAAEMDVLFNADFTDPGSTVSDSFENGLTAIVTGEVDTSIPGTYTLTYNVSDSAGNAATEVQRTVHVVDQQGRSSP